MNQVQSMTGFGRAEVEENGWSYTCEIKSLNSRFIETNIRMPRSFASLEAILIAEIKSTLVRGKVDVFFEIQKLDSASDLPQIDQRVLEHYLKLLDDLHDSVRNFHPKNYSLETKHNVEDLLALPEMLKAESFNRRTTEEIDAQKEPMLKSIKAALQNVIEYRKVEGEKLKSALVDLLNEISACRQEIEKAIPDLRIFIHDTYKNRLEKVITDLEKVNTSLHMPPEERIVTEVTYLAEKADIEEEITRIKSHEAEFLKTLEQGGEIGRKLDFLCQEFHREVNTISSKLQPTEISSQTLKMKQAIERIRQQVQNIE